MKHVVVVGDQTGYYSPFRKFGKLTTDQSLFNHPDKVAMVLFTGGADIHPSLYGHKASSQTYCVPRRDVQEMMAIRRAKKHQLPIVGICRGAQFLCAMAGGTLIQHVNGHGRSHSVQTIDGREMFMSSTHHQMQNPPQDAVVLAWANPRLSDVYVGQEDKELEPPEYEYECVYYPSLNALGMQYHPEAMSEHSAGFRYASELVDEWLFD
jgi:gamma-glutamyl-gamma-aminobutyrate hydrolase PuuD